VEGVTPKNPEEGFNQSSMKRILLERQASIFRTRGIKSTGLRKEGRDISLVKRNQALHRHAFKRKSVFRA
jgi:hypothetical protein